MLLIRDRNDTFGFRALDSSLGFLLGALGGSLGLTSGPWVLFGVSWGSLGFLLDALEAVFATDYVLRGAPKRPSNNIRISNADVSKMLLF